MSKLPIIKWAQRKDSLFVTIDVPDSSDAKIDLTETHLTFKYEQRDRHTHTHTHTHTHNRLLLTFLPSCLLVCRANSHDATYECSLEFFKEVDPSNEVRPLFGLADFVFSCVDRPTAPVFLIARKPSTPSSRATSTFTS